ncbi:hypothetical protein M413DRAFT_437782 [Hebeloma cylindrosporum]|uniref:Uncharacterized protein n=1 Tax=Hebeloma cylindrosporum TaxID=76867 RepID=A0A0C3CIL2_HEBCY|nr:hypothetical protein M413DRAFT_437782 [Hebeloma cylindrosporum h7]
MVALRSEPGALFLIFFIWNLQLVLAGIVNRTIDDAFGDSSTLRQVAYLPTTLNVWQDLTCSGCLIRPDTSRAFKGTYTAATYSPQLGSMSITMKFNGTAIYVFFILANNAGDELFQHAPDLSRTDIDYNQLVYSKEALINAEHTLVISTSGVDTNVYVNFDYVIYTHDDDAPLLPLPPAGSSSTSLSTSSSATSSLPSSSSTTNISQGSSITPVPTDSGTAVPNPGTSLPNTSDTKSSPPIGAIIGGVIGGIVFLSLVIFLLVFCSRRRAPGGRRSESEGYIPPLMEEMGPPIDRKPAIITPFTAQPTPVPFPGASKTQRGYEKNRSGALNPQMSPSSRDGYESAYGGYVDPNANGSATSVSGSGRQYHNRGTRTPLRSVTDRDHLSSFDTPVPVGVPSASTNNSTGDEGGNPDSIEAIRRARQNEIDERLRAVQEEVTHLTSDLQGEKGGRQPSVRRRGANKRGDQEVAGEAEEMTMAEMREQLSVMKEQIGYLREQQRSAWAQGLSDDPPPGYTLNPALRYSGPTVGPPS